MTADDFRRLALDLPGVAESSHMGHPDFRINGKIFATLHYPDEQWGMVKLSPEQQDDFVQTQAAFVPVKGAWGRKGSTGVFLEAVDETVLQRALRSAWSNRAEHERSSSHGSKNAAQPRHSTKHAGAQPERKR